MYNECVVLPYMSIRRQKGCSSRKSESKRSLTMVIIYTMNIRTWILCALQSAILLVCYHLGLLSSGCYLYDNDTLKQTTALESTMTDNQILIDVIIFYTAVTGCLPEMFVLNTLVQTDNVVTIFNNQRNLHYYLFLSQTLKQ
jgi:hypothetical protein